MLSLEEAILENQAALLHSSPGTHPKDISKKIPAQAKDSSPEVKVILLFALYSALRTLNSTITTAKGVPDLHICGDPKRQILKPPMRIKFCKYTFLLAVWKGHIYFFPLLRQCVADVHHSILYWSA